MREATTNHMAEKKSISIGSWISMGSPYVAEIMAQAGFDWLVIDMEHSAANDLATTGRLIQVIDLAGCKPLARIASNDPVLIKQVMDAGAHGVIVPQVNTPAQAEAAVAALQYPPQGVRGVGLWRAQGYGRGFEAYRAWLEEGRLLIVQIEHIQAVENLNAILAVEGVDGFIIGPYDLSASLGFPGDFEHARVKQALAIVERVAQETEKMAGYHIVHPDMALFKTIRQRGYNFIAYGVDFTFLTDVIDRELSLIRDEIAAT